ncbi:MAG: extracellular solute-binding protein [Ruminococcus sp.]|nr:extracellular solute-binding protein [Ruminococcus sp.]
MKTTTIKRTLAGIFAAAMLCSAASCSAGNNGSGDGSNANGKGGGNNSPSASNVSDKTISNVYRSVELTADIPMDYVANISKLGDSGNYLVCGSDNKGNSLIYVADSEFSSFTELDLGVKFPENSTRNTNCCVLGNGNIAVMLQLTDYGDFKLPDYDDPDFDYESFDFDAMQEASTYSNYFIILDSDGNVISSNEPTEFDEYKYMDGTFAVSSLSPIGEDKCILSLYTDTAEVYLVIDMDGKIVEKLDLDEGSNLYQSCMDADHNLCYISWENDGLSLKRLSASDYKPMDNAISLKDIDNSGMTYAIPGDGDYEFYLTGSTSLYGIKSDGTVAEIINWIDSDINGSYINAVAPLGNGEFVTYERDWNTNIGSLNRLTKRDASELADTEVITLAVMYADSSITSQVTAFNKQNDKVRVKIKDYSSYYEYDEQNEKTINTPSKQLKMDIVSGNRPDMICCYDISVMNTLAAKGTFADLNQVMSESGTIKPEDIMPNVVDALSLDGKLYYITPSFSINTLAIKSKNFDKENWTLDELIETYKKAPEGTKLFNESNSKESVFYNLYYNMTFTDDLNGTCSFDSPDFLKLLEFVDTFDKEADEPDWDNASQEEMDAYYTEQQAACRNDKALLSTVYLSEAREYARAAQGEFGDKITLVGYPSDNGQGAKLNFNNCYAITEDSEHKDACWEFISCFFDYSNANNRYYNGFPVLQSEFEKTLDQAMDRPFWTDDKGEKQYYDDSYWISDTEQIDVKPLTKEERDFIADYIKNTSSRSAYYNEDVYEIVNEEIEAFFNGERSAQETADLIQNRASIVLSEQN